MNREIRFRAYTDGKMFHDVGVIKNMVVLDYNYNEEHVDFEPTYYGLIDDSIKLMQYTGLNDKHETPIYEGDIVKCQQGCPHEVIWLQEYGGTYFGGMPAWYLSGIKEGYSWSGDEEVIGNIFEDSHLLEEST